MHIEGLFRVRFQGLHDRRADREIGHEMAVHDIHMDKIGASVRDGFDLVTEPREIGRQNRSSNANGSSHHRH